MTQTIFLTVINMSITGSFVTAFIILARLLLKKAPRVFSYALWAIALFRLVCPFSFSSAFSLLSAAGVESAQYVPADIATMEQPQINIGISAIDNIINQSLPAAIPVASTNPLDIVLSAATYIWIIGILAFLLYSVVSYALVKHLVAGARHLERNIYETGAIETPFVLGILKPRIYLPAKLHESEREYILLHEQTHIKRLDYLIKPISFLVLTMHWFNPAVWLAYSLMSRDMEISCDEKVIAVMGTGIKKDYSMSLLSLSTRKKLPLTSPLAFGESNAKTRIKNVLKYKRSAVWIVLVSMLAVALTACALLSNPEKKQESANNNENTISADIDSINLRLNLPAGWEGKYEISNNGYVDLVAQKNGGLLFTVERREGTIPEEYFANSAIPTITFYADNYTYLMYLPTDVQAPNPHEKGEEALAEYLQMVSDLDWVFNNMETIVKKEPLAENAGFKVVGTGDFLMEVPKGLDVKKEDSRAEIRYNFIKAGKTIGSLWFIPYFEDEGEQVVTDEYKTSYVRDDENYSKVRLEIFDSGVSEEDFSKMADSFKFRGYGGFTGIDFLTNAERYLRSGGEKLFGMIEGFVMENNQPVAANVKLYSLEQDSTAPNGIIVTDLEKTETIPFDLNFGPQIMPLASPDYNQYDLYYMPQVSQWALNDGGVPEPYNNMFFNFIVTNGQIKMIIGRYIP